MTSIALGRTVKGKQLPTFLHMRARNPRKTDSSGVSGVPNTFPACNRSPYPSLGRIDLVSRICIVFACFLIALAFLARSLSVFPSFFGFNKIRWRLPFPLFPLIFVPAFNVFWVEFPPRINPHIVNLVPIGARELWHHAWTIRISGLL